MREYRIDYRRMNGTRISTETASRARGHDLMVAFREGHPWSVGARVYEVTALEVVASVAYGRGHLVVTVTDGLGREVPA